MAWLLLLLPLLGCQSALVQNRVALITTDTAILKTTLRTLNLDSPKADVEINVRNGDFRFICICSYACDTPGVEEKDALLRNKLGYRCLEGTSDRIESDEHMRLIKAARQYAELYNAELLKTLKLQGKH